MWLTTGRCLLLERCSRAGAGCWYRIHEAAVACLRSAGQLDKIVCGLGVIEAGAPAMGARVDIGTITLGCVLGYLDLRFAHLEWRSAHPQAAAWFETFNARPAMQATLPRA